VGEAWNYVPTREPTCLSSSIDSNHRGSDSVPINGCLRRGTKAPKKTTGEEIKPSAYSSVLSNRSNEETKVVAGFAEQNLGAAFR